jgi:hypothetical protein
VQVVSEMIRYFKDCRILAVPLETAAGNCCPHVSGTFIIIRNRVHGCVDKYATTYGEGFDDGG